MADSADIAAEYIERVQAQTIENRVRYSGVSARHCIDCDEAIPERRRELLPGVQRCVECQQATER